jgi:hypothetical protein
MTEDDLLRAHDVDPGSVPAPTGEGRWSASHRWIPRARPTRIERIADSAHLCPGDGKRGCLTMVPDGRLRCRFCATTVRKR